MSGDISFSIVPEAPMVPSAIADMVRSQKRLVDRFKSDGVEDPCQVPLDLPILQKFIQEYPKLELTAYNTRDESRGTNVLAFLHNAAKREIADIVGVVIPALEHQAKASKSGLLLKKDEGFGEEFDEWWKLMLRFFFFVAETNDEIVKLLSEPVVKILTSHGDYKTLKPVQKKQKSISDRYEFAMEFVFRAADNSVADLETLRDSDKILKAIEKLQALVIFILDTMEMVMGLAAELEMIVPDLEIGGLEYVIADNLSIFAKTDKPVLIYTCARWMNEEKYIRPWITKYGGLWGRMMYKSWQKTHKEKRAAVIESISRLLEQAGAHH